MIKHDFKTKSARLFWYRGIVTNVVDGDTMDIFIDRGFNEYSKIRIRLVGIDTPELRDRDEKIREQAKMAARRVRALTLGKEVLIRTEKAGGFGRWLADVWVNYNRKARSLSDILFEEGLAEKYTGRT